jgi:hypothetical protein
MRLQPEIAICYQRRVHVPVESLNGGHGIAPEEDVDNFWIGCLLPVDEP